MSDERNKWKSVAITTPELSSVHDFIGQPLNAALWCLYVSKNQFNTDYLTCEYIGIILQEFLDIPLTAAQITKALAPAGKKVIRRKADNSYKISSVGEKHLTSLKSHQPLNVVYVDPNKPRTAKKNLSTMVTSFSKDWVLICDPYYGMKTLEVLEVFAKHHKTVKFLTAKIGGSEKANLLATAVADFKKEFKNVEIKMVAGNDIHDRYIITKGSFLIIGQGIKDLGNKESLIVAIEDRYGEDMRHIIMDAFNKRWTTAISI